MRRLQLTFYAPDAEVHPVHTTLAEREYVEAAEMVHWNAVGESISHVFRVAGDRERFGAALESIPAVLEYDLSPAAGDRFYAYIRAETTPVQRELFEIHDREGIVVTSSLEHTDDGGVTFEVVGEPDALQSGFESAPDGIRVEVERVGGDFADAESVLDALSPRQREAVAAALAVGYYDVPRTGSHEEVAAELDCSPSTAAEHIRKAESKVLRAVFGE